jgi:hypothetical protein
MYANYSYYTDNFLDKEVCDNQINEKKEKEERR